MGRLLATISQTEDLCSLFQHTQQLLTASAGPRRAQASLVDCVMWISWWLWPLVAICAGDRFRDEAERIMRGTPVIDG